MRIQTGVNSEFEDHATDKFRGTLDAAEYKHVVLGFIFLGKVHRQNSKTAG